MQLDGPAGWPSRKWRALWDPTSGTFRAGRSGRKGDTVWVSSKNPGIIFMHNVIMGVVPGDGWEVDHKDHNGLNNCRDNLSVGTKSDNLRNRRKWQGSGCTLVGVDWNKAKQKYRARITDDSGNMKHLGYFNTEAEAGQAVIDAARRYNYPMHAIEQRENELADFIKARRKESNARTS